MSQEMRIERFAERHPNEDWSRSCFGPDDYEWNTTRGAWVVWQAALAAERKRLKEALQKRLKDEGNAWRYRGWSFWINGYEDALDWAIQQIETINENTI